MRPYGHIVADSEKQNSIISIIQLSRHYYVAGKGNIWEAVWDKQIVWKNQNGIQNSYSSITLQKIGVYKEIVM